MDSPSPHKLSVLSARRQAIETTPSSSPRYSSLRPDAPPGRDGTDRAVRRSRVREFDRFRAEPWCVGDSPEMPTKEIAKEGCRGETRLHAGGLVAASCGSASRRRP